jgi:hypothetical protein
MTWERPSWVGGTGGDALHGKGGLTADNMEEVVEIVGDATGQLAQGLHFLRLSQLAFEFEAFGDVAMNADKADQVVLLVDDGRDGGLDPDQAAVLAARVAFAAPGATGENRPADGFGDFGFVLVVAIDVERGFPADLVIGESGEALKGGVDVFDAEGAVDDADALGGKADGAGEAEQFDLACFVLRDVDVHAGDCHGTIFAVFLDDGGVAEDPAPATIFGADAMLAFGDGRLAAEHALPGDADGDGVVGMEFGTDRAAVIIEGADFGGAIGASRAEEAAAAGVAVQIPQKDVEFRQDEAEPLLVLADGGLGMAAAIEGPFTGDIHDAGRGGDEEPAFVGLQARDRLGGIDPQYQQPVGEKDPENPGGGINSGDAQGQKAGRRRGFVRADRFHRIDSFANGFARGRQRFGLNGGERKTLFRNAIRQNAILL